MKKLLKQLFPIVWLKRWFLLYNRAKIATLDQIIYNTYHCQRDEIIFARAKNPFLSEGVDLSHFSNRIKEGFSRWTNPAWTQDEYLVHIKRSVQIDPQTGWGVVGKNYLIYQSLGFGFAPYVHKPKLYSIKRKNPIRLDKVISLRDTGEENYFHFFNDVLPKIWLLQDHQCFDITATILVSEKLFNKEYFQHYRNHPTFQKLKWFVQRDEWIETSDIIFCKPYTHTVKYWARIREISLYSKTVNIKRVYLKRSKASLRYIENEAEVDAVVREFGFHIVDTAQTNFQDQIDLFKNADIVIGVHGAGLSNVIFKNGGALTLLEIFHPNEYLPFQYILLSRILDIRYLALLGAMGREAKVGGFVVDCNELRKYCQLLDQQ